MGKRLTAGWRVVLAALIALAAAAPAAAAPIDQRPAPRIVGGSVADPADWPFAAALMIKTRSGTLLDCGAAIISPRYALTAAHCVVGIEPDQFSLVVARPNLRHDEVGGEIKLRRTKIHPEYGPPRFRNDVALLELRRRTRVTPVAIPTPGQDAAATAVGAQLRVAGWGGTRPNGSHPSKRLREAGETVIDPSRCRRVYGPSFSAKTTICTRAAKLPPPSRGHAGSCYGDSGGPLIADTPAGPLLVGTVSGGGFRCGTSPDYYARVADTLRFIRRVSGVRPAARTGP